MSQNLTYPKLYSFFFSETHFPLLCVPSLLIALFFTESPVFRIRVFSSVHLPGLIASTS